MKITASLKRTVRILFESEWLRVLDNNGYIYSQEVKARHGEHVILLPYRRLGRDAWEYLLRNELCPAWSNEPILCGICGTCEAQSPVEDAVRELKEEAGYTITAEQLQYLGCVQGTKSTDSIYHLYAVDVADLQQEEPQGDETGDVAPLVWTPKPYDSSDPMIIAAYCRARKLGIY
jgi:8-oxo-dGTP pyrophosphatase MutT (NUDIX family)